MSPSRKKKAHPADKAIGRALLSLRETRSMSHVDVSDRLGLGIDALAKVESGERALLARELLWMLDILDTPLSEFGVRLGGEDAGG